MKLKTLGTRMGLTILLLSSSAACIAGQTTCLTDSVGVRGQQRFIETQFTDPDPVWRRELGLPDKIQGVTLVDSEPVCAVALSGLRARGDSLRSSTSARVYLFRVDPGLYVTVGDADLNAITFFDRRWRYITTLAGLN